MALSCAIRRAVAVARTPRLARRAFAAGSTDIVDATIGLTETQAEFYNVARKFAEEEFAPHADLWDEKKIFPEAALRQAAALGFGGVFVKEDVGGSGLSRVDGSVIFEALSRGCTSTTAYLSIHNMCCAMLDGFGTDAQRTEWLPALVSCQKFASYCLTEPGAGSDAGSLTTRAVADGGDYVLSGAKAFISGAGRSDVYLIMCRTGAAGPKGISCFIVPSGSPGLSFGKPERKMGWSCQPTAIVNLDGVRVPASARLGTEGGGFAIAMRGLDGGRLSIGTCSIGAASACFDIAREHIKTRKQFGAPLSDNQHLQFKLADMATDLHVGRTLIRQAAAMLDAKDPSARSFCAMAKRVATDNGFKVCNDALQMLGGYGYLRDHPVERFLRDVRVHQILEGTNEIMRVILSRQLLQS